MTRESVAAMHRIYDEVLNDLVFAHEKHGHDIAYIEALMTKSKASPATVERTGPAGSLECAPTGTRHEPGAFGDQSIRCSPGSMPVALRYINAALTLASRDSPSSPSRLLKSL